MKLWPIMYSMLTFYRERSSKFITPLPISIPVRLSAKEALLSTILSTRSGMYFPA